MNRTTIVLAVLATVLVLSSNRAFAQEPTLPPGMAPATSAPAPQPAPPPPEVEIESETEISSETVTETPSERSGDRGTNVNVEVGVRAETPAAAPSPAPRGDATRDAGDAAEDDEPQLARFLHGFRLGYLYIHDIEGPVDSENPSSQPYGERYGIRSPHMFMLGYELAVRIFGHDWLNMLLIGNVLIAGFEQSRFFPSANLMLGFEFEEMLQVGVGVSLTPTKDDPAHLVVAAGWTPRVGEFYLPIHFFFVPDINGHHKVGATLGVTF